MKHYFGLLMIVFSAAFLLQIVVSRRWPNLHNQVRRALLITLLGLPALVLGYLFGYLQSGFITGYMLYRRFDGGGK